MNRPWLLNDPLMILLSISISARSFRALRTCPPRIHYENTPIMYIRSIGIAGLIIGTLFKTMHWPTANVLIVVGGLLAVLSSVVLLLKRPRPWSAKDVLRPVTWVLIIAMLLLELFHLPFASAALVGAALSTVALILVEWKDMDLRRILSDRPAWFFLISIALTLSGSLLKVMHWPGASMLLVLGMTGSAVWFLIAPGRTPSVAA